MQWASNKTIDELSRKRDRHFRASEIIHPWVFSFVIAILPSDVTLSNSLNSACQSG